MLHRVRPTGSRPKVDGYDEEERTAHVYESGTDRHNAPRPRCVIGPGGAPHRGTLQTQTQCQCCVAYHRCGAVLILPMLQVLLQREIFSPRFPSLFPNSPEEQAIEADSNAYDLTCAALCSRPGADWDGSLTAGLYTVGQDLPEGTYTIVPRATSIDLQSSAMRRWVKSTRIRPPTLDASDSERDDVSLPTGTVAVSGRQWHAVLPQQ